MFIVFCFESLSIAQTAHQWAKYGNKSFEEKDYYGASLYFKNALTADTLNLEIINKYAAALRLFNDYAQAEKYYRYLLQLDKNKAYPETVFWLATLQKNNAKYQDARKNFLKYKNTAEDKKVTFIKNQFKKLVPVNMHRN
ncbi:MAG: hypothetical protein EAZ07_08075 [Cytophagales bacterium]|nr:MAG: hypothetical protein EAZ07_08075 [Cytophagales bacterium]